MPCCNDVLILSCIDQSDTTYCYRYCWHSRANEGSHPASPPNSGEVPGNRRARALYACKAEHDSELSFIAGCIFQQGESLIVVICLIMMSSSSISTRRRNIPLLSLSFSFSPRLQGAWLAGGESGRPEGTHT